MTASGAAISLLRDLVQAGRRVFSVADARQSAARIGLSIGYLPELLRSLRSDGWIVSVTRGWYAITEESGFLPPHPYEIATAVATPSAISYWTALYHHHLTQQIPRTIFVTVPLGTTVPRSLSGEEYQYVRIKPESFFGMEKVWVGDTKVSVMDPERSLLDGLMRPEYCGGFEEALHAFRMRGDQLDIAKIIDYALRLKPTVAKRLGWVLEHLRIAPSDLSRLLEVEYKGWCRLNPLGPRSGPLNHRWRIQENLGVA